MFQVYIRNNDERFNFRAPVATLNEATELVRQLDIEFALWDANDCVGEVEPAVEHSYGCDIFVENLTTGEVLVFEYGEGIGEMDPHSVAYKGSWR